MIRLYVVRHGQTAWNAEGRYQGSTDVALNDVGRAQVRALAPRLAPVLFSAVYSSALSRARETALLLDSRGPAAEIRTLPGLNEMSYGAWETHTREEITHLFPDNWRRYKADPVAERPLGGESRPEFHTRVLGAVSDVTRGHHEGDAVLLAVHGGTLRALATHVLGMDLHGYRRLRFDNASLSVFELRRDLSGVVALLNETVQLAGDQATPR